MATSISTVKARDALKARHEPHFIKLSKGQYLGFQKLTPGSTGNWIARSRDYETGKQRKRSLGDFGRLPASDRFDAAKKEAEAWFKHLGQGGTVEVVTVRGACENYVAHLLAERGPKPAHDLQMRFQRRIYCDGALADTELSKLTKTKVENWRKKLLQTPAKINRDKRETPLTRPRAAGSVNRDMSALRAALNYAHDAGHVVSDMAWRVALRPIKNADGRRDVYLDTAQRRKLIENAPPDAATFLRGLSLVPLRPGALAGLTIGGFDQRLGVLTIGKDKAGKDRKIKLPPQTAEFFAAQAIDKLPAARLFTRADGKAWHKDAWKWPIKEAAAAAGLLSTTTAYAMRHSVITDLVTHGLDLLTVAQISGTSVAMIEKHYGHLLRDHAAKALASLTL